MSTTFNQALRRALPVGVLTAVAAVALVVAVASGGLGQAALVCGIVLVAVVAGEAYRYRAGDRPVWRRRG